MTKVKDPVCGMTVDTEKARSRGTYNGEDVFFCDENCRRAYEARRAYLDSLLRVHSSW